MWTLVCRLDSRTSRVVSGPPSQHGAVTSRRLPPRRPGAAVVRVSWVSPPTRDLPPLLVLPTVAMHTPPAPAPTNGTRNSCWVVYPATPSGPVSPGGSERASHGPSPLSFVEPRPCPLSPVPETVAVTRISSLSGMGFSSSDS